MSPSEKPAAYRFVFLRHAESVGNVESRWQGQSDYPLTEKGRAQARALCERWQKEDVKFDLVITSTLVLAQETAQIVTSYLQNVKIEFNPILMERCGSPPPASGGRPPSPKARRSSPPATHLASSDQRALAG